MKDTKLAVEAGAIVVGIPIGDRDRGGPNTIDEIPDFLLVGCKQQYGSGLYKVQGKVQPFFQTLDQCKKALEGKDFVIISCYTGRGAFGFGAEDGMYTVVLGTVEQIPTNCGATLELSAIGHAGAVSKDGQFVIAVDND